MCRVLRLDDVEVKHAPVAGSHVRQFEAGRGLEPRRVPSGPLNRQVVPRVDALELGAEDARMEIVVEPAVETKAMDISRLADPWLRSLRTLASMLASFAAGRQAPPSPNVPRSSE